MLNLNIYFDEYYWLEGRRLLNPDLYQSSLLNKYYKYLYKQQKPLNNKFIKSGPQKLVNNTLSAFWDNSDVVFNKDKFDNYYFCTYTAKHRELLLRILKSKKKVLVGPLYTVDGFHELTEYANKFKNLRIACASISAQQTMKKIAKNKLKAETIKILPVGVAKTSEIFKNQQQNRLTEKSSCLIYLKGKKRADLSNIIKILNFKNIRYEVFEYGSYDNTEMLNFSRASKFGIIVGRTESQGIAINELMSTNLPLFVVDSLVNHYNNQVFEGTSVPYWDKTCGIKINKVEDFENSFEKFLIKTEENKYQPYKFVIDKLSYEAMAKNLFEIFKDISF